MIPAKAEEPIQTVKSTRRYRVKNKAIGWSFVTVAAAMMKMNMKRYMK